jgi:rhodanese-related sulfurtransferase
MNAEKIIKNSLGTVLDVRTPAEFMGGSVPGAINIPLQEIPQRVGEIKKMAQPLVLCCASGNRSGQAQGYLTQLGVECVNGGSWLEVNYTHAQNI